MRLERILGPESDATLRAAYDERIAHLPDTVLQHSSLWGLYQDSFPDRHWQGVFVLREGEADLLSASVVTQDLPRGYCYILLARGYVTTHEISAPLLQHFVREIAARIPRALFVRIDPCFERGGAMAKNFEAVMHGLGTKPAPAVTPTTTLLLDLSLDEVALQKQMHPKGRYNIRVAEKHAVLCRTGTVEDLPAVHALLRDTAARTGIAVHGMSVYARMLEHLGDAACLELAESEGTLLAAMITTRFAGTTTYYYGASGNQGRNMMAPYALQWHAIRKARVLGDRWYDFLGIAPPEAGADHPLHGVTDFKRKFGGLVRREVEPRDMVLRPALTRAFHLARRARSLVRGLHSQVD